MSNRLSRRELLAAFLGLPAIAALEGCGQQSAVSLPPGELVGASADIGHRIRDGLSVSVPNSQRAKHTVVIVGGGVAGLSAARRLQMAGLDDFVILELEPEPGGTSRSGRSSVSAFPWGAHYVPAPMAENRAFVNLLDEMNVFEGRDARGNPIVAEQYLCRDPEERVFYKGRWYEGLYLKVGASPDDLKQLDRFQTEIDRWVGFRDARGRRAFTLPMASGSDDALVTQLDKHSMADWLDQHQFTSPRLRWLVDYACRDDYGLTAEQTSAWAGLFYFTSRVAKPGDESRPLIAWPEGNGRLVAHFHEPVHKKMHTGMAVTEIAPGGSGDESWIDVTAVSHDGQTARGFRANFVVFAAPQFLAPYLIRPYRDNPPAHVSEFQYGAWMVANITLRGRPEYHGFAPAWDNVLYESPSLGYVMATHQRSIDHGPTVLTYYYPLCDENPRTAREKLLSLGRDDWAEIALSDLWRAHHNIRELVERIDVMRWGHAMIQPRPGFIWGSARREAAKPLGNIHFAHSDLSGVALFEEAFYRGTLAAENILEAAGRKVESILNV